MIAGEPFGTGCGQRVPFPGSAFLERKHRRSMWSTSAAPPDEQASCPRTMLVRCSFRNSSPPLVMHLDWGPAGHDHPPELHPIGWRALSRAPFSARSCSGMPPPYVDHVCAGDRSPDNGAGTPSTERCRFGSRHSGLLASLSLEDDEHVRPIAMRTTPPFGPCGPDLDGRAFGHS